MTETKTPPPSSELTTKGNTPSDSMLFENSSFLDLDDPNITGSLFEAYDDGGAELLLEDVAPTPLYAAEQPVPMENDESSFAQLWAATLTEDLEEEELQQAYEAHPPTVSYFAAWQEAAERHHLPAAVELLPPILPQEGEEPSPSESPPTGFFPTEDAPLFFVDEQWSPNVFSNMEPVLENPFEESVAVLKELSFQNTFMEAPSPHFGNPEYLAEPAAYVHPEINLDAFPEVAFAPAELQHNVWLVDAATEEPEEIILLEDELPPETETPEPQDEAYNFITPASLASTQTFAALETTPTQSFPPKIPPVAPAVDPAVALATSVPSLLTPAIFYDEADTPWPPPPALQYSAPPPEPQHSAPPPELQHSAPPPELQLTVPPELSPEFQIQGLHEVVLYTMSGTVKRGTFQNADLSQPSVPLQTPDETEHIPVEHIKAVYFLKPGDSAPHPFPPSTGSFWKVTFNDGRRVEGQLSEPQGAAGFFLVPKQRKTSASCLYINRSAIREMLCLAS
ncbi:MAG: hypothetical protein FWG75_08990 [Cystobacterineae bacterium]|nr:hypothetical protein [Cystobacterineae bacterium]